MGVSAVQGAPPARWRSKGGFLEDKPGVLTGERLKGERALRAGRTVRAKPGSVAQRTGCERREQLSVPEPDGDAGCGRAAWPGARVPWWRASTSASHSGESAKDFKQVHGIRFEFQ